MHTFFIAIINLVNVSSITFHGTNSVDNILFNLDQRDAWLYKCLISATLLNYCALNFYTAADQYYTRKTLVSTSTMFLENTPYSAIDDHPGMYTQTMAILLE